MEVPPPNPTENLEIEYGCYCFVTANLVPDCIRSYLRESKFKIFGGGGTPPDSPSRHTHLCACFRALLLSCFPTPQLKILYETLWTFRQKVC